MCKEALGVASNFFAQTGREIFAPRINNLLSILERKIKLSSSWKEQFEEYWLEMSKRFYIVSSVIFGNTYRTLSSIYVPMELQMENMDGQIVRIDCFPKVLLDQYGKLLIKDTIGMGKSTMLKYMFLKVISMEMGFPVFVELRNLKQNHNIESEIQIQLSRMNKNFDHQLMVDFFREGGFIFFLDGFDEIAEKERNVVVKDLSDFISKGYRNQFVMTSRNESALAGFGDFVGASVLPLSESGLINLIQKYGNSPSKTKSLVERIMNHAYSEIDDFLHNPLLAGIMYKAYIESSMSDLKIYQLCSNIFPVFYDQHDLSKDGCYIHKKRVNLSPDDYERILGFMGLYCYANRFNCLSELEFIKMIRFVENQCSIMLNESDLIFDLTVNIPLFCKDGTTYRWIHQSLCAYYLARYIYFESKDKTKDILLKLFTSDRISEYVLALRMFSEMDSSLFDKHLLFPFLSSLRVSYQKERSSWLEFINKKMSSSNLFQSQMNLVQCIHPELFKHDMKEGCRSDSSTDNYYLSEEGISNFVNLQNDVELIDDTPENLIVGL